MKFNWGTGIVIFFVLFVAFMVGMVYKTTQHKNELVTEQYYEKELEFTDVIRKSKQAMELSSPVKFELTNNSVLLKFPDEIKDSIAGIITFFKPSNKQHDKRFSFSTLNRLQEISFDLLSSGLYKIQVDWQANNVEYYIEDEILIPE